MAKLSGTSKSTKSPNPDNDDITKGKEADAFGAADETSSVAESSAPGLSVFNSRVDKAPDLLDLNRFSAAGDDFGRQLKSGVSAFEEAVRGWTSLSANLASAKTEIERLRGVEIDRERLDRLYVDASATNDGLRADLDQAKLAEVAGKERISNLEEVVETVKEKALEIHNALQESRANEQKLQSDLATIQTKLVEFERAAQDESVRRTELEDRNATLTASIAKLEADEADVRGRFEKLSEDNRLMATQVPKLLADRDNWQKQFAASERENTRMLADRKVSGDRIGSLEEEIRVLRADIASLTNRPDPAPLAAAPLAAAPVAAAAVVETASAEPVEDEEPLIDLDELDLAASLDQAFASDSKDSSR